MNWDWMADTLNMIAVELNTRVSKGNQSDRECRRHIERALQSTREARDSVVAAACRVEKLRAQQEAQQPNIPEGMWL